MSRKEPVKPVNDLIRFWNQAANGSNDEPKNPLRQQTMPTENPTGVRQGPLARRSTAPLQAETSSNAKSSQTKTAENSRLTSGAIKKSVITNLNDSQTTGNASSSKKTSIGMTTSAALTNSSDSDNKPEMEPPGTSFSIINIQTLSTKTDKGRMNWSSLPQPASSDPLSSSSTGTSPAIAALEKIRNSTQENVDLFTRRQSVRGPRPPTDRVGTLITKFKSATNSGVTSPKSPDSPTGEQRTHELVSPTSPISIGSFEETVTRAFSSDGAFSPPLSPPGVRDYTDKRGKTSKYIFDK
ncbi:6663_t:CDS:1, partial [Paraglomus occultum]